MPATVTPTKPNVDLMGLCREGELRNHKVHEW